MNSLDPNERQEPSDGEYVVSSRNGCPDHFRLLVQRYQRPLFAYLSSRLGNQLEAEEAAQESFVRAFLSLKKLRKPRPRTYWLKARAPSPKLSTIHLRGQLRTLPADNFSYIDANGAFYPIELWKQFPPEPKWRIEKPGRVIVMDGLQTVMYIKSAKEAVKIPQPTPKAFDTDWLHRIANLSDTINNELRLAQAQGWKLELAEETAADGRAKSIVTVHAKCGLPENDYARNKFFHDADTRRVYRFDGQSERLEAVQIYLVRSAGEVQVFDLSQIDYDQPIDPSVWQLNLPADVGWYKEPQKLADNQKYASMTAQEAAHAFFEACVKGDWTEAEKFISPVNQRLKDYLGGLEIVSLGKPFTSQSYPGQFVPYEIKLKDGTVKKHNLAVRKDNPAGRWQVDGGI